MEISSNNDIYSIFNTLNNQYQDLTSAYTDAASGATSAASTEEGGESTDESEEERETYGLSLLEYMDDESYESFTRATDGLDDATKERFASALQIFTGSYASATSGGFSSMQTLLNADADDEDGIGSLLGSSTLLKITQYSMREGSEILAKMATGSGESMQDLMVRLKNALSSGSGIDYSG